MELLIAILMFFGIVSPDAATSMSDAEKQFLINSNQPLIEQAIKDPAVCDAAAQSGYEFDRRED